ncbi:winged helix-turn-helix domain-containing protein [Maricaulis sp.]|uniref:winged helix-turn-helix domain-containing protein n=1 Tax=Maricaulis sp. TaxID=1486257 RepID=UPI0026271C09|nr:winged helix-turn-helix domain-containing protein [Maricaulis sp.]
MNLQTGFQLEDIRVEPGNGRLIRDGESIEIEPKVMALLVVLAEAGGEAVSREAIGEKVWPGVTVNEDALSRAVWKLRRALGDEARDAKFVVTVPKRGYRLAVTASSPPDPATAMPRWLPAAGLAGAGVLLAVVLLLLLVPVNTPQDQPAADLIARADDFYAQMTQSENEAAMRLYQRALEVDPGSAPAHAGLANTITQSVVRWSPGDWPEVGLNSRIQTALANGRTATPQARQQLERALGVARQALEIDPGYAPGYRALGLASSAMGDINGAMRAYDRAVTIDPDNWESLMNLSDLYGYQGQPELSLRYLEQSFEAMTRRYDAETARIRPWHSGAGLMIASRHAEQGRIEDAERWYRRVLHWDPFNSEAIPALAAILIERGEQRAARELCAGLSSDTAVAACSSPGP